MIGRRHHLVVDAPDPQGSAAFWSAVLGEPVTYDDGDFVVVSVDDQTSGMAFQRAPGLPPSTWPGPGVPQQMHVDVMVEDVTSAGEEVLRLGARALGGDVYADPAGHPFCLVRRPSWATPIESDSAR
ncbi:MULTISPECIES: VOC family protein [Mumia]|uniref:VOC family protein n=1 Tax=Mumia TaxID=1546255 RepID=UPI001420C244|nr:VOC family protein [Mumia sp. ZJ1417]QMW64694.1 VOC family protein [Mumia sp. ZJ1417]